MKSILASILLTILTSVAWSQIPQPALVGYFQNWQSVNAPYVQLDQIDSRYNVVEVAFAIPQSGTDYLMEFIPDQVSQATFITQIQTLQSQGRKVLLSIGGATAQVSLSNTMERDSFISSMTQLLVTYPFDGIDLDLEGSSVSVSGGTISTPTDLPIIYLIDAVKQIMDNYRSLYNRKLLLTMAPETAYVQGGQSAYGGLWGAYLPIIHALRDSIDLLQVQLYNSGSMYGIDGGIYTQGTADFIVAMTEAVIQGFSTGGGLFTGLPASKLAVAMPACSLAAGGGFTDTATVSAAINYLRGTGPKPGVYSLTNAAGYPDLGGMMTWSINWDALTNCGGQYTYAANFQSIFWNTSGVESTPVLLANITVLPNPASEEAEVVLPFKGNNNCIFRLTDIQGCIVHEKSLQNISQYGFSLTGLPSGIYLWSVEPLAGTGKLIVVH